MRRIWDIIYMFKMMLHVNESSYDLKNYVRECFVETDTAKKQENWKEKMECHIYNNY